MKTSKQKKLPPAVRRPKRRRRSLTRRDPRLWLYGPVPAGFWDAPDNRRTYMEWLGEQLKITHVEEWYQLRTAHLLRYRGRRLLLKFHSRPIEMLKEYLPSYPWQEWRFLQVPNGFWDTRANRCRYLDWLGEQLGFTTPEDWYRLSSAHLRAHHGGRLLTLKGSPAAIVKDAFPRQRWLEWKFAVPPEGFWEHRPNRLRFLRWLGHERGYQRPTDWYQISNQQIIASGGHGLVKRVRYSLLAILQDYRPTYDWQAWQLASAPDGFWEEPSNRRRYLDWLGQHLGYRRTEDWYRITWGQIVHQHGSRLLTRFGNSPQAVLRDYQPDYDWKEWLFTRPPPTTFWTQATNRRRYFDWLGVQLGYTTPKAWARVRETDVRAHAGTGLLRIGPLPRLIGEYLMRP